MSADHEQCLLSASAETPMFRQPASRENTRAMERLTVATRLLSGWVWETDAAHRFTYMSDTVEEFTGRPAVWHYGRTRQEIGNVCDPGHFQAFQQSLESRACFSEVEFTRIEDDQSIHMRTAGEPYYEDGTFRGYRGIAYRISGEVRERCLRHEAEERQRACSDAMKAVIENYPNAIVAFDAEERMVCANQKYYETLGFNRTEVLPGISFAALIERLYERGELRGISAEAVVEHHRELVRSSESMVFERSRPNGRIIRVQGFPLPCGGFARTFTDVTERSEDKWTIAALKDELRRRGA